MNIIFVEIILNIILIAWCTAKYAPDSEDEVRKEPDYKPPSSDSYEDTLADKGTEDRSEEADLPEGFELMDGVIMDTTNLMVQEVTDNGTQYKMYYSGKQKGQIMYKRSKREAGWHFILFEDPLEESGTGHLVLLQKLLGFTHVTGNNTFNRKELRLYEVFHVDLGNDITEDDENEESNKDLSNEEEAEGEAKKNAEFDPNDSAEIVPSMNNNEDSDKDNNGDKEGDPVLNDDTDNQLEDLEESDNSAETETETETTEKETTEKSSDSNS